MQTGFGIDISREELDQIIDHTSGNTPESFTFTRQIEFSGIEDGDNVNTEWKGVSGKFTIRFMGH